MRVDANNKKQSKKLFVAPGGAQNVVAKLGVQQPSHGWSFQPSHFQRPRSRSRRYSILPFNSPSRGWCCSVLFFGGRDLAAARSVRIPNGCDLADGVFIFHLLCRMAGRASKSFGARGTDQLRRKQNRKRDRE